MSNAQQYNNSNSSKEDDQPLRRSKYNIYEAHDDSYSLYDSSSVHPLQTQQQPYSFDLSPNQPQPSHRNKNGDLNSMMKDLDLSAPPSNTIEMSRSTSMPYCV